MVISLGVVTNFLQASESEQTQSKVDCFWKIHSVVVYHNLGQYVDFMPATDMAQARLFMNFADFV